MPKLDPKRVLAKMNQLMRERHGEPIRSRQIEILAEVVCEEFNNALEVLAGHRGSPIDEHH